MWLLRPIFADPPLCTLVEIKTALTIDDVADLHEILDLKDALSARAQELRDRQC